MMDGWVSQWVNEWVVGEWTGRQMTGLVRRMN